MTQSRPFWRAVEAIHDVVYFAPDAKERYEAIGLKGYWMGYVASRSAAVGTPSATTVTALFHGFAPAIIERALPDAWGRASRDDILAARLDLARDALAPALEGADVPALARALTLLVEGLDFAGKPLSAAHADLPAPDDDLGRLWHAATVVREYRGDCHVAVLTAAGLDGCAANALSVAAGLVPADQRTFRGWSEGAWQEAIGRLVARGWVVPREQEVPPAAGELTDTGRAARNQIEDTTDRVCGAGFDREATARAITVEAALVEVARRIESGGAVGYPNPHRGAAALSLGHTRHVTLRRSFWHAVETIHHVVYFSPHAKPAFEAIGLKGYWMGYFASRSAALGRPGPEVVTAAFHGFAPRLVHRALPAAWERASRDDVLRTRYEVARATISPGFEGVDVARLAQGLQAGLPGLELAGRPLAAGHRGLPVPDDDLAAAWHAATVLREYRGDSHLAVLTAAGLDGVEANVLAVAAGLALPGQQQLRGWDDERWATAATALRDRGWIDADDSITEDGIVARTQIETDTDRVTAAGISAAAVASFASVADLAVAASKGIVASGAEPSH